MINNKRKDLEFGAYFSSPTPSSLICSRLLFCSFGAFVNVFQTLIKNCFQPQLTWPGALQTLAHRSINQGLFAGHSAFSDSFSPFLSFPSPLISDNNLNVSLPNLSGFWSPRLSKHPHEVNHFAFVQHDTNFPGLTLSSVKWG